MFARVTFLPSLAYNLARNRWSTWNWYDRIDSNVVLGALPFHGPVTYKLLIEENIGAVISMNENFELQYTVSNQRVWQKFGVQFLQLNTPDIFHAPSLSKLEHGVQFMLDYQQQQQQQQYHHQSNNNHLINQFNPTSSLKLKMIMKMMVKDNSENFPWKIKNNGKFLEIEDDNLDDVEECNHQQTSSSLPSVYVHCKAGRTRSATLVACYLIKKYGLTPEEAVQYLHIKRPQVLLHTKQWQAIRQYYDHHHYHHNRVVDVEDHDGGGEEQVVYNQCCPNDHQEDDNHQHLQSHHCSNSRHRGISSRRGQKQPQQ